MTPVVTSSEPPELLRAIVPPSCRTTHQSSISAWAVDCGPQSGCAQSDYASLVRSVGYDMRFVLHFEYHSRRIGLAGGRGGRSRLHVRGTLNAPHVDLDAFRVL